MKARAPKWKAQGAEEEQYEPQRTERPRSLTRLLPNSGCS